MTDIAQKIWTFANPNQFMRLSAALVPYFFAGAALAFAVGVSWALFGTPPDHRQGEAVKIFFIHVPAAILSVNIAVVMVVASVIGLVRSHPVSHLVAKSCAPVGAAFTAIAIVTGALWGQPIWGTYWVWDPRLTSILVVFFFYIGYLALWDAIEDPNEAATPAAILCVVGALCALFSRYAVEFYNSLHQDHSLRLDGQEAVADIFYYPLVAMILAHYLLFGALLMVGVRTEIRARRIRALRGALGDDA
ncbi:MAG: heme ABC transporter permease CcmC [Pseudomonadota bacterium]